MAFAQNQLSSITIPNSVITIGDMAFAKNSLVSITIPNSVTAIGNGAFGMNQLTSVAIPDNVTTIGMGAFGMNQLSMVNIPNFKIRIDEGAFTGNPLTSLTIGENTTTFVNKENFILSEDEEQLITYAGSDKDIIIPTGVSYIMDNAFLMNQLTSVEIPDSVTTIGAGAFMGNNNILNNPIIASFYNAISEEDEEVIKILNFIAYFGNQLTTITIPSSVIVIGEGAFMGNQLSTVTIPNSVTMIGVTAFMGNQLTTITIPNSVTTITGGAFMGNQLTTVTIPNSVTTIEGGAFMGNRLASISIPNSVRKIESIAFFSNPITRITIGSNVTLEDGAIENWFDSQYNLATGRYFTATEGRGFGKAAGTYTRASQNSNRWVRQ